MRLEDRIRKSSSNRMEESHLTQLHEAAALLLAEKSGRLDLSPHEILALVGEVESWRETLKIEKQDLCHILGEDSQPLCGDGIEPGIHHGGRAVATCIPCLQREGSCATCSGEHGMRIWHEEVCHNKLRELLSEHCSPEEISKAFAGALHTFREDQNV